MFDIAQIVKLVRMLIMVDADDPPSMRRWRFLVAICILAFAIHVVWACGLLQTFGIDGFAQNHDLKGIGVKLDAAASDSARVQERLLEKSIIDVRIQQCNATSKRFYTDHLRELTDYYYNMNHRTFEMPDCQDLN
jgi:hypothetical protein